MDLTKWAESNISGPAVKVMVVNHQFHVYVYMDNSAVYIALRLGHESATTKSHRVPGERILGQLLL